MNKTSSAGGWQKQVRERLPLLGHRNWIAVVDSAYPWQIAPGIETISTGAQQLEVVAFVLRAVKQAPHVRPILYLDAELARLPETEAGGVTSYRRQLHQLFSHESPQTLAHEKIISLLDKAGSSFRVLILKSTLALPYTSVFMQLDCGYWSADAEKRLRGKSARLRGRT